VTIRDRAETMYAALANGDTNAILPELHPDVEYHNPPEAVEGGVRRGPEEFVAALNVLTETLGQPSYEIEACEETPDTLTAQVRIAGTGNASGVPVDARLIHRFELRDGLLYRFEWEPVKEEG